MKMKLETIPLWDAVKEDTECPICFLKNKDEKHYVEFFLGNSVMIPEMRVKVNATGYCGEHFKQLLAAREPHYLGLQTHTHFNEVKTALVKDLVKINKEARMLGDKKIPMKGKLKQSLEQALQSAEEQAGKCMICEKLENNTERYIYTVAGLWKKDKEFREAMKNSKGFCYSHLYPVLTAALNVLSAKNFADFSTQILETVSATSDRVDSELLTFTQMFDAQKTQSDWGTSKDAPDRAIQILTGLVRD